MKLGLISEDMGTLRITGTGHRKFHVDPYSAIT
jgi:hypothetical protein